MLEQSAKTDSAMTEVPSVAEQRAKTDSTMAEAPSAAEQALKKLADQLTCAVCLEDYKEPKLLQCFHAYCKDCLALVLQDPQRKSLNCPSCRRPTPLPQDGISGLRPAFHIHHLFDIRDALVKVKKVKGPQKTQCDKCKKRDVANFCHDCQFICMRCTETHEDWPELSSHRVISLSELEGSLSRPDPEGDETQPLPALTKKTECCSNHPKQELDLYCDTCETPICRDCIIRDHRDHRYDLISKAFTEHKEVIADCLQPVRQQLQSVREAMKCLDSRKKMITDQQTETGTDIRDTFQRIQEALDERKAELIGRMDQLTRQKLTNLAAQRDEFKRIQTQLSSCLDFVSESFRTGSLAEILAVKKPVVQQITEMTAEFKPDVLALVEQADIKFTAATELLPACKQFGQLYTHPVCPEKCRARGNFKGLEVATVGEQATAILYVVDKEGKDYVEPVVDVTCELTSCTDSTSVKGSVEKREGNCYDISYQPTRRGRHQLHIKVVGQHIRGSPFDVVILAKFATPTRIIGAIRKPRGVVVTEEGKIVVAEKGADDISILDATGNKTETVPAGGSIVSGWIFPCGIAIDDGGNVLVTDTQRNCIRKFVIGNPVTSSVVVGREGRGPLQFNRPAGIGTHPRNKKIYVCDSYNHRVQILNSDLTLFKSFGSSGRVDGKFNRPSGVAFDKTGKVYIADANNHRVQVFTEDGQFLKKFGKKGTGDGELNTPVSITVDSNDIVYVSEYDNHRVSIFTCLGQFLRSFRNHTTPPGQFEEPRAIAVDGDGLLYVCDYYNNCIEIF